MALIEVFAADPGRTVGHDDAGQADLRDGVRGPNVRTCQQLDLLLKRQAPGQFADPGFRIVSSCLWRRDCRGRVRDSFT